MSITVNLLSNKDGEIKKFLESYYEKEIDIDNDVDCWMYVYRKPLESVDIISAVMDNSSKYKISLSIQLESGEVHNITEENYNDVVKGIFSLFYEENIDIMYV